MEHALPSERTFGFTGDGALLSVWGLDAEAGVALTILVAGVSRFAGAREKATVSNFWSKVEPGDVLCQVGKNCLVPTLSVRNDLWQFAVHINQCFAAQLVQMDNGTRVSAASRKKYYDAKNCCLFHG